MKLTSTLRRRLLIVTALAALFSIAGFLLAPLILKAQLEKRLSSELGRRVTVEKVGLNPFALSLTLENFTLQEPDGTTRFLGWNRLFVNFDAWSSLWGEWVLSEIALDGFNARVAVNPDQSFNFSDVLARVARSTTTPPAKPSGPPRPVRIASLKVSGAQVAFSDASRRQPFATTVGPLTFTLTEFRTVSERGAPYRFEAVTEANERLAWSGTLQAEPLRSSGELIVENIVLAKYAPYYADRIQADLVAGTLSVRGGYELRIAGDERMLQFKNGALHVRGVKLLERATQEPALELPDFTATGVHADPLALKATIEAVALTGGHLRARREKDGTINVLTMLTPPARGAIPPAVASTSVANAASPSAAAPAMTRPDIMIRTLDVKDFRVEVADLAAPRPTQLALSDLQCSLQNVTLAEGAQIPLQLAFTWAPQGTVRLEGTVALAPMKADMKLSIVALELLPVGPYLEQFIDARLTQGAITAALTTQMSLVDSQPFTASLAGDLQVDKLGLVDGVKNEELAGFGALSLRGLRASTAPQLTIAVDEITLSAPFARVILNADKTLNLASIVRGAPAAPPAEPAVAADAVPIVVASTVTPPSAAGTAPRPQIEIGKIVITDGDYRFTDRSIEPNAQLAISEFGATLSQLSSSKPGNGAISLKALVDGAGPITIVGKLDPLGANPAADLKIDFKNIDLVPLSPYSGRFAGYELARGKLLLEVKLRVDGTKIDAANVITLNHFTFGQAVQSPDATKLPVRLGVALLKDGEGNIVLDVPIQGSLDDPKFDIGGVVARVVGNVLTKAATSPFTLLGAAIGGGGDELAFQEFAPGSADISPAEMNKLEKMVKALTNRPALSVALEGSYDAAADAYALKRVRLAEQVRRAIWEQNRPTAADVPPPADHVITPEETVAAIKKLYDEKFPPGTQFGAPVPPAPAVVEQPAVARAGFFQRVVRAITRQDAHEQRAAAQESARLGAGHAQAVAAAHIAGLPFDEMHGRLADAVAIEENDLHALAEARAQRVRDYFVKVGGVSSERLFVAEPKPDHAVASALAKGPRVFLTLQ